MPPLLLAPQVAESLPWSLTAQLVYLRQNHNSVIGMREEALPAGATVQVSLNGAMQT